MNYWPGQSESLPTTPQSLLLCHAYVRCWGGERNLYSLFTPLRQGGTLSHCVYVGGLPQMVGWELRPVYAWRVAYFTLSRLAVLPDEITRQVCWLVDCWLVDSLLKNLNNVSHSALNCVVHSRTKSPSFQIILPWYVLSNSNLGSQNLLLRGHCSRYCDKQTIQGVGLLFNIIHDNPVFVPGPFSVNMYIHIGPFKYHI